MVSGKDTAWYQRGQHISRLTGNAFMGCEQLSMDYGNSSTKASSLFTSSSTSNHRLFFSVHCYDKLCGHVITIDIFASSLCLYKLTVFCSFGSPLSFHRYLTVQCLPSKYTSKASSVMTGSSLYVATSAPCCLDYMSPHWIEKWF